MMSEEKGVGNKNFEELFKYPIQFEIPFFLHIY